MQSRGIPMRVAAELAGIPTSTFHRNYPYWEGYIYDSDGRIIGEKCSERKR
nr:MAG TPA: Transcriptional regulator, TetR family Alpha, Helix-Turn-Helix, Transcriptional Repressor.27A [Caudoviricetes sp.]